MGAQDGKVLSTTKIVDKGPASSCFNIVLMAEGYKDTEQSQFETDCQTFVTAFNSLSPFNDCGAGINFYRINIRSTESGADDPTACGGTGTTVKTYLDASYCTKGIRRLMSFNTSLALQVLNKEVPAWHRAVVLVNSSVHGGAGGTVAITSTGGTWTTTALHEFGHSLGLADEYATWFGCPPPPEPAYNQHSAVEPVEPNVTTKKLRSQIKWRQLILPTTPVPTTTNTDCTRCDPQPDPMAVGTIGLYEGAHYCHCGAFRPAFSCLMRSLGAGGFCAVCEAAIRKKLAPFMQQADLAITPWGYAQSPPKPPWWQTPDIWGTPVRGEAKNDLHVRVKNQGTKASPPFKVRLSFVPFTTVIDLANEVLIGVYSRPALSAGGVDSFTVNWDLTPPALPPKYATFDHFCVIAKIQTQECNTTNNEAQNNFVDVPVKKGTPPPPLRFEIANPWPEEAWARLVFETRPAHLVQLEALDFHPQEIPLARGERRVVKVALWVAEEAFEEAGVREAQFQITQLLNDQILGGIGGVITIRVGIQVTLGGHALEHPAVQRAIAHAVPWAELTERIEEAGPVTLALWDEGPIVEDARAIPTDPDRARELLAEAGFPDGLRLRLLFAAEDEPLASMAEIMAETLGHVGIAIEPMALPAAEAPAVWAELLEAGELVLWLSR